MSAAREFADVVLCCDADERFENNFLDNLRKYSESVYLNRNKVIGLRFRELWNSPITYRNDGIWNEKTKYILFQFLKILLSIKHTFRIYIFRVGMMILHNLNY